MSSQLTIGATTSTAHSGMENRFLLVERDRIAVVVHRYRNPFSLICDGDVYGTVAVAVLEGVPNQVGEHLTHPRPVPLALRVAYNVDLDPSSLRKRTHLFDELSA